MDNSTVEQCLTATEHQLPRRFDVASITPTPSAPMPMPGRLFRDRRALPRPEPGAALVTEADLPAIETLRRHWPEYLVEAGFLALFLLAAGVFSSWLLGPTGTGPGALLDPGLRRLLAGVAVGLVLM